MSRFVCLEASDMASGAVTGSVIPADSCNWAWCVSALAEEAWTGMLERLGLKDALPYQLFSMFAASIDCSRMVREDPLLFALLVWVTMQSAVPCPYCHVMPLFAQPSLPCSLELFKSVNGTPPLQPDLSLTPEFLQSLMSHWLTILMKTFQDGNLEDGKGDRKTKFIINWSLHLAGIWKTLWITQ